MQDRPEHRSVYLYGPAAPTAHHRTPRGCHQDPAGCRHLDQSHVMVRVPVADEPCLELRLPPYLLQPTDLRRECHRPFKVAHKEIGMA